MIPQDDLAKFSVLRSTSPITQTNSSAAFVGQIIDVQNLMSLWYAIFVGTWTDADATSVVLVEHGDAANLSDAAAVPDAELLPSGTGQEAAASPIFSDDDSIKL